MNTKDPRIKKAFDWLSLENGENFLASDEHCPTLDIFQARLARVSIEMEKDASLHYDIKRGMD